VVGGAGFGWYWYQHNHVSEEAQKAYAEALPQLLLDKRATFPDAEKTLQKAVDEAAPAPYPDALGSLAELHIAWGEQLFNKATTLAAQADEIIVTTITHSHADRVRSFSPARRGVAGRLEPMIADMRNAPAAAARGRTNPGSAFRQRCPEECCDILWLHWARVLEEKEEL